jgi:hypothetical protein
MVIGARQLVKRRGHILDSIFSFMQFEGNCKALVSRMKVEGMVPYQLLSNQLHDLTQDEPITNMNVFHKVFYEKQMIPCFGRNRIAGNLDFKINGWLL